MSRWRSQHSPDVLLPALRQWFSSPMGRTLINEEQSLIDTVLLDHSGARNHLLKLSPVPERLPLSPAAGLRRQFHLGSAGQTGYSQVLDAVGDFHQLPIANESQDIVVLHHLLEFVENPHKVLREVERVTVPHGKVIICGINPYSLLALRGVLGKLKRSPMWQNHRLSISRLQDWLSLLGFEIHDVHYAFHRVPVHSPGFFMHHAGLPKSVPLGGIFVISATKYRAPLTPAQDPRRQRAQILRHPAMLGATRGLDTES